MLSGAIGAAAIFSGSFSPLLLGSSLLAWWAGDRSDLITSSAAVSSWRDVKNAYNMAQGAGASQPAFSSSSFNGLASVTFDHTDDELTLASQPFPSGAADVEIWAIVNQVALAADGTNRAIFAYGNDSNTSQIRAVRTISGGVNRFAAIVGSGGGTFSAMDTAVNLSGRVAVRARVTPTATYVSVNNGVETSQAGVPAIGTTRARLGSRADNTAGNYWDGSIRDVVVTGPLSAAQSAQMMTWALARR